MALPYHLDTGPPSPGGRSSRSPHETVLFLHGLGGSAASWRPQFEALAYRYRCIAWTLPGYGPSPRLADVTIPSLAAAAADLLAGLGVERASVVGHSMGGYIAQELALGAPARVDRLVLAGTTASFGKPGSSFNDEFLAARLRPLDEGATPADLAPAVVTGLVGPSCGDEVVAEAVASMAQISPGAYRDALAALVAWDARSRLDALAKPVLCIAGDRDETAPVRAMERLAELVPGATLAVLERCGHLMNQERPARFNQLLDDFLGRPFGKVPR